MRVLLLLVLTASLGVGLVSLARDGGERPLVTPEEAKRLEEVTRELEKMNLPSVGLGEFSPARVTLAGWKTNGKRRLVPLAEFRSGGPGRDGIPALTRPRVVPVSAVRHLAPQAPVIELVLAGAARAYPLEVLVWHEIVNDVLGGRAVAVTFCPLCNTALVFDPRVGGRVLEFGVTGLLRNSDLVMYDRQTETWWQQFGGLGLIGDLAGTRLRSLPARIVRWDAFAKAHPDGTVVGRETGHDRPYGTNPYPGYDDADSGPWFAAANEDDRRLRPKEVVVFVEQAGEAIVVPVSVLQGGRTVRARLAGRELTVRRVRGGVEVLSGGRAIPHTEPFWFAVAAFRPNVRIVRQPD
ncbi:MAG: DUF3179 domain-containing protein [Actinobacteria bacterium]|nr:DUF3179 domain-containing protein [Actinomycetota bacterium]